MNNSATIPRKKKTPTTKRALITSLLADLTDVTMNGIVAVVTGSIVMLARTLQGVADVIVDVLLLIGFKRAKKMATRIHPFGFGKETYFWTLLAGIVMLLFTATLSFYFGLQGLLNPGEPLAQIWLAYLILGTGMLTNGYSVSVSARKLLEGHRVHTLPKRFTQTLHVAPRTTFVLDMAGFLAALLGLTALVIYGITGDHRFDGLGAIAISILLAVSAVFLLSSAKTFIIGRRASSEVEHAIKQAALQVGGVNSILDLRTMVLGHRGLLVNLEVHFKDNMITDQIEEAIDAIKRKVARSVEGRVYIQVEPETPAARRTRQDTTPNSKNVVK